MDFWQQYQHPSWQRKRLEVMSKHNFRCEDCGTKDDQLHVHHRHYRKGAKVWEYESWELSCLCGICHQKRHEMRAEINKFLARIEQYGCLGIVLGFLKGLDRANFDPENLYDGTSQRDGYRLATLFARKTWHAYIRTTMGKLPIKYSDIEFEKEN